MKTKLNQRKYLKQALEQIKLNQDLKIYLVLYCTYWYPENRGGTFACNSFTGWLLSLPLLLFYYIIIIIIPIIIILTNLLSIK